MTDWPAGLLLLKDYVSEEEEAAIIAQVDAGHWAGNGIAPNPELRRRTQQYGYEFSYRYRKVMQPLKEPIPSSIRAFLDRLVQDPNTPWIAECGHIDQPCNADDPLCARAHTILPPDSVIVNEYQPGQGIMPHVDAPALFGPVICSLSLLSDCLMTFEDEKRPEWKFRILLPRRSLLVMRGYTRYRLRHSISKDLVEELDGITIQRQRRVSLTIRRIGGYGYHSDNTIVN